MSYDGEENEVRDRITWRLARLKRLFIHMGITLVVVIGLTFALEQRAIPADLEVLIPAAVLLFIAHAFWVMWLEAKHYIVQQEMSSQHTERQEKLKHSEIVGIGDDGELVELPEDEIGTTRGEDEDFEQDWNRDESVHSGTGRK